MMFKRILVMVLLCLNQPIFAAHDPTAPISGGGNSASAYKIEGIFITSSKRLALIAGKYYIVGDEVNGGKIVAILKDRIVVSNKQGKKVYPLTLNIRKSR